MKYKYAIVIIITKKFNHLYINTPLLKESMHHIIYTHIRQAEHTSNGATFHWLRFI